MTILHIQHPATVKCRVLPSARAPQCLLLPIAEPDLGIRCFGPSRSDMRTIRNPPSCLEFEAHRHDPGLWD
jgi:hypothetical protein